MSTNPQAVSSPSIPPGLNLILKIEGDRRPINSVSWSPDGQYMVCGAYDGTLSLWEYKTHKLIRQIELDGSIQGISWSPDSRKLAVSSADGSTRVWEIDSFAAHILFRDSAESPQSVAWSPRNGHLAIVSGGGTLHILESTRGKEVWRSTQRVYKVNSATWSPDGRIVCVGCADRSVRLLDSTSPETLKVLKGHRGAIDSIACSPNGRWLATGSRDHTIRIWELDTGRAKFVLEGHLSKIVCLSFAANSRFLASQSLDGNIRIWRCENWETAAILKERNLDPVPFSRLAFSPSSFQTPLLAEVAEEANLVRVWELNAKELSTDIPFANTIHYSNAKVVLVGDSSVGKTGLALVLTGRPFKATESTHGRFVHLFETLEARHADGYPGVREILLWDLAGQPGYRMIHQLHLDDVAVALVVFDSRSETDPFAGVKHWSRALRLAERLQGSTAPRMKKFLIAARADRGAIAVSKARLETVLRDLEFDGYLETSAKEGWRISELRSLVCESISWDSLPTVSSTDLFQRVRSFLLEEKRSERLLSVEDDLYRAFVRVEGTDDTTMFKDQVHTCIGRMESQGLLRRISFGGLVLLQPELLDGYASMLVNAAKEEPDGLGSIPTEDVLAGRFKMPQEERLKNKDQEKLLLLATAEELIGREIALKEVANDGSYFIFPSQLTREPGALDMQGGPAVVFEFHGAVLNIYVTLAVRLSHSEFFKKADMWKNAATYRAQNGGLCGVSLREIDEGHAEITLSFDHAVTKDTRTLFTDYVHTHLLRRALAETVVRRRICVCEVCQFIVTDQLIKLRAGRGFDWAPCPVCESRIDLCLREEAYVDSPLASSIPAMDRAADAERDREVTEIILSGKKEIQQFDVFLAHKTNDKSYIVKLAEELRRRRLNPWLDKEQIPPGRWFQDVIQRAIPNVKSAAICIGPSGLGKWQALELRSFISECIERDLPVIPVLLPGVSDIPPDLPFLRELNYVKFTRAITDEDALQRLVWGITGKHPGLISMAVGDV